MPAEPSHQPLAPGVAGAGPDPVASGATVEPSPGQKRCPDGRGTGRELGTGTAVFSTSRGTGESVFVPEPSGEDGAAVKSLEGSWARTEFPCDDIKSRASRIAQRNRLLPGCLPPLSPIRGSFPLVRRNEVSSPGISLICRGPTPQDWSVLWCRFAPPQPPCRDAPFSWISVGPSRPAPLLGHWGRAG